MRFIERANDRAVHAAALSEGFTPLQASVLSRRFAPAHIDAAGGVAAALHPPLRRLDPPRGLPDLERAAVRLARAVEQREVIGCATDVDCDGATSQALLRIALVDHFGHPPECVTAEVSHKTREGYGVTDAVVDRFLQRTPRPTLIVTADQGSSDEPRIRRLAGAGIDVVVGDHHVIPTEGPPASAFAVVSPQRTDSTYPDRAIAGCYVTFLIVAATRRILEARGTLPPNAPPLTELLDLCAASTVADCVDMAGSLSNRILVHHGLRRMNAGARACWRALAPKHDGPLDAAAIAWSIAPRINARARMSDPMAAVHCLLARDAPEAAYWAAQLEADNQARRATEAVMATHARAIAAQQVADGADGLAVYLPDGHPGVVGIVAARLVETYGRPSVCLAPRFGQPRILSGSLRSIDGYDVRAALERIARHQPNVLRSFGGHAMAAGLTLEAEQLPAFRAAWDYDVAQALLPDAIGPRVRHDGELPDCASTTLIDEIAHLDPFGRRFEAPLFTVRGCIDAVKPIGRDRTHLRLHLRHAHGVNDVLWFNADVAGDWRGRTVHAAFEPMRDRASAVPVWRARVVVHVS